MGLEKKNSKPSPAFDLREPVSLSASDLLEKRITKGQTHKMEDGKWKAAMSQVSQRPSWDEYFLKITEQVAERSTCLRRQTGAILVKEKRILATGYNGAPSGLAHCSEVGCLREQKMIASAERHELCRGLHAEQNAIIQAAFHGIEIEGATLYCTHQPCVLCAKMIINAGIKEIFFRDEYPDSLAEMLLRESKVKFKRLNNLSEK